MCRVEVIDTAGQGMSSDKPLIRNLITLAEEYSTLRNQWIS